MQQMGSSVRQSLYLLTPTFPNSKHLRQGVADGEQPRKHERLHWAKRLLREVKRRQRVRPQLLDRDLDKRDHRRAAEDRRCELLRSLAIDIVTAGIDGRQGAAVTDGRREHFCAL